MPDQDAMLQEAIEAIARGETAKARDIITRLLRVAPNNPEYWVWMSAAVDTPKERRYCLQKALAADPSYEPARRGMLLLGDFAPAEEVQPVRVPKPRAWEAHFKPPKVEDETASAGLRLPRRVVLGVVALFLLMALSWGAWGTWQRLRPVNLPTPQLLVNTTRTPTPVPSGTPTPVNPLTLGQPTPLALLLPATYTPTPLAVSTPHLIEAFRLGLRAMDEGRWQDAVRYFQQTAEAENNASPDIFFYLGEAYTHLNRWQDAANAYRKALKIDPHFAPAQVGLAQVLLHEDQQRDALKLLSEAIANDPNYGQAYLVRARYELDHGKPEDALADLDEAARIYPDSPLVHLYRAQAYLALDEPEKAHEEAKKAHDLDLTLLPAYKVLGQTSLALGQVDDAILYFRTYLTYAPNDPEAYGLLAQAYFQQKDYQAARVAAEKWVDLSPYNGEARKLLAKIYLALGQPQDAVDTLETAVRIRPHDFDLRMALVEALLANDEAGNAFRQLKEAEPLLKGDEQWYTFYYWRAKVLMALNVLDAAVSDWQRVLDAPEDMVPDAWREEAQEALSQLWTPTPSPVPTLTPTSAATATPTPTP
ncbi:MAG: tetratricopeptide repeat protein [Chloroflexi bacterium]|nr:tetratricopeptide repeat protein [Chloroflexota bacterium]